MALNQRRVKILHLIREDGHAKVQDLSKIFNVTDVTIRQDLEALEQMGYIQREHGGAFLKGVGSFAKTGQLFNQTHLEEKKEIAQKAIQFIQEGDSIILDSGSTYHNFDSFSTRCLLPTNTGRSCRSRVTHAQHLQSLAGRNEYPT